MDEMAARRELQLASIPDIQGSIQANDTKSSAALVVHGLLFAGVVTIVGNSGGVYADATLGAKITGGLLLLGAAVAFGRSVLKLIEAARPHDPESTRDVLAGKHAEAFFPPAHPKERPPAGERGFEEQLERLAKLETDTDFEEEYAAEQVKLADIRVTQAHAAKIGFEWLRYEIFAAGAFLLLVAMVALGVPALARGEADGIDLAWRVADADGQTELAGSATTPVRAPFAVTLVARGEDVERSRISGAIATSCSGGKGGRPPIAEPVSGEETRSDTEGEMTVSYRSRLACAKGQATSVTGVLHGEARTRDGTARADLTIRATP
jgi:hypothetical protein